MDTNRPPSFRKLMTFRLHMIARLSEGISEDYYRQKFDLTLLQCRVIGITAGYGTVTFKQMAEEAHLEKSYASRIVASLAQRDLLAKSSNPSDSRSVLLQLTEQGRLVHRDMYMAAVQLNRRLQSPFSAEEVEAFLAFLSTLEERLGQVGQSLHEIDTEAGDEPVALDADESEGKDAILLDRAMAARLHALLSRHFDKTG